jgi:hypothetical protein
MRALRPHFSGAPWSQILTGCRDGRARSLGLFAAALAAGLFLACATQTRRPHDAVRLNSYRLQADREDLSGELSSVTGYLISAGTIGHHVCLKVLVDETLRFAPDLLIANQGWATQPSPDLQQIYRHADPRSRAVEEKPRALTVSVEEETESSESRPLLSWMGRLLPWTAGVPSGHRFPTPKPLATRPKAPAPRAGTPHAGAETAPPLPRDPEVSLDLRLELKRAEAYLEGQRPAIGLDPAIVLQACKSPPTRSNRKALQHALLWLEPLRKPERIVHAPSLTTLRRELQLHYLEQSRNYEWAPLAWNEVVLTGRLLDRDAIFEGEVIGGVDMIPYVLGVRDAQRNTWLFIDLSSGESVSKEFMMDVLREGAPRMLRKAGGAALGGGLP